VEIDQVTDGRKDKVRIFRLIDHKNGIFSSSD